MRRSVYVFLTMIFIVSVCFFTLINCTKDSDKIPITTSSEKALDNYLKGRDLFDKLQAQESIQYFKNAIEEDPDFAVAYLNLSFTVPSAKEFFENLNKAVALADKVSEGEKLWIKGVES
jgi:tetratricopeptide (TPR) repeat protein